MKLVANHSLCTGQVTSGSGKLLCVEKNFCANLFVSDKILSWKLRVEQNFPVHTKQYVDMTLRPEKFYLLIFDHF